jgi:hypothetical protein
MSQTKFQNGIDLDSALKIGMILDKIRADIVILRGQFDQFFLIHHLYEGGIVKNEKWLRESSKKNLVNLTKSVTPLVKKINEDIKYANKLFRCLDFKKNKIPSLPLKELISISRDRLNTLFNVQTAQVMSDKKFELAFEKLISGTRTGIKDFFSQIENEKFSSEYVKISEPYRLGIKQALDVCSIGYYSTAVFIAGRTTEELINDYFKLLFKLKRSDRMDLKQITFENKVGKLLGFKEINKELFHRLNNIVIDRNEFGHPSEKILTKREAHLRINQIIELTKILDKKIIKLKGTLESSSTSRLQLR